MRCDNRGRIGAKTQSSEVPPARGPINENLTAQSHMLAGDAVPIPCKLLQVSTEISVASSKMWKQVRNSPRWQQEKASALLETDRPWHR